MSRNLIARSLVLSMCLGASATLLAQSGSVADDPPAALTVSGTILHVVSFPASDGAVGLHFDFQTATGTLLNVHAAPALFVGQQNVSYFADDQVDIVGVKAFIGKTLTMRGPTGAPGGRPASKASMAAVSCTRRCRAARSGKRWSRAADRRAVRAVEW
jgi:hypothetical protein